LAPHGKVSLGRIVNISAAIPEASLQKLAKKWH
jgi:hypothetical protein